MCSTATAGGNAIDPRLRADPYSRTRNFSNRPLSSPSLSSSVDCGTPRNTGPSSWDVVDAGVLPDIDGNTSSAATTPSQARADQSGGASGTRQTGPSTPDRPLRRKNIRNDALGLLSVELDQVNEESRESSVCI